MANFAIKFEVILPAEKDYPKSRFDLWDVLTTAYFVGELRRTMLSDFDDTVKGWNHKPNFKATFSTPYQTRKQLLTEPYGRYTLNWTRVSAGTRDRTISPRGGNSHMTFQRFYAPHTKAGGRWGMPASDYGPTVRTRLVKHHSIEPRKFAEVIVKKEEKKILNDIKEITERVFGR